MNIFQEPHRTPQSETDSVTMTEPVDSTNVEPIDSTTPSASGVRTPKKHRISIWIAAVCAVALVVVLVGIPYPVVIEGPGPTFNVIGTQNNDTVIHIDGARTYPTDGELRMVTVSLRGGPGAHVTGLEILNALWDSGREILDRESVYPSSMSRDDIEQVAQAQMESSQSNAEVAALDYLGIATPATMTVSAVPEDSPSHGILEKDDVLVALQAENQDAIQIANAPDVFRYMSHVPPHTPVTVTFTRQGTQHQETVTSRANPQNPDGSLLGIYLKPDIDMPYKIQISLQDVGGPSAGMMFAVGIVDLLTPGAMAGKAHIAGTGAISMDGQVEPISGVPQKMAGAVRDGATYFFVPEGNCDDIVGAVPQGLTVVKTATLAQTIDATEKIARGQTHDLPSCPRQ